MYALRVTKFNSFDKCISTGQLHETQKTLIKLHDTATLECTDGTCAKITVITERSYTANYSHSLVRLETCKLRIKTFAMKHC